MPYKVFISHSMKDKHIAGSIVNQVKDAGADVVMAENATEGSEIKLHIADSIRKSDEIIAIVTKDSAQSAWLNYEIGAAAALGKRLTPVLVQVRASELPPVIRSVQGVKIENFAGYLKRLAARIHSGSST